MQKQFNSLGYRRGDVNQLQEKNGDISIKQFFAGNKRKMLP